MTDSLQSSFQRIQISEEDFKNVESVEDKIPILAKSAHASCHSQKLRDVSPICVIVVGMAGSGKTTLMAALQRSLGVPKSSEDHSEGHASDAQQSQREQGSRSEPIGYCLNLDPATKLVPFGASIDIRDTVDYKVREQMTLVRHHHFKYRKHEDEQFLSVFFVRYLTCLVISYQSPPQYCLFRK